jgi:hypothetical protein
MPNFWPALLDYPDAKNSEYYASHSGLIEPSARDAAWSTKLRRRRRRPPAAPTTGQPCLPSRLTPPSCQVYLGPPAATSSPAVVRRPPQASRASRWCIVEGCLQPLAETLLCSTASSRLRLWAPHRVCAPTRRRHGSLRSCAGVNS